MTGERLFLRYVWPCARVRLDAKKISQQQYNELEETVRNDSEPRKQLLAVCFPGAYKDITNWSYEFVVHYWRYIHRHDDEPVQKDVWQAIVIETPDSQFVSLQISDRHIIAINEYRIPLRAGDIVYGHKHMIVEKI